MKEEAPFSGAFFIIWNYLPQRRNVRRQKRAGMNGYIMLAVLSYFLFVLV